MRVLTAILALALLVYSWVTVYGAVKFWITWLTGV